VAKYGKCSHKITVLMCCRDL